MKGFPGAPVFDLINSESKEAVLELLRKPEEQPARRDSATAYTGIQRMWNFNKLVRLAIVSIAFMQVAR